MNSNTTLTPSMATSEADLRRQLATLPAEMIDKTTQALAHHFQVSEYQLVMALPTAQVTPIDGQHAAMLLQELAQWGPLTTVIMVGQSVFEFKGDFPAGSLGYGYYNFSSASGNGFQGHLHLDSVSHIALLEKPHRQRQSYSILFFAAGGRVCLKFFWAAMSNMRSGQNN